MRTTGGARISSPPDMPSAHTGSLLSPNGRLFAAPYGGQGAVVVDTETGNRVWERAEASRVVAWSPDIGGFLYVTREGT